MTQLLLGDCLEVLPTLQDNSVDSIVTDPPYGLSFMGKGWDYQVPTVAIWQECFRVLKPGGHLLAFAGTRTQHRMAVNIEDAGFEIRDMIAWVYGSGFPKSRNIGDGWGTALKPALEPITVARKPFKGTVAANVLEHGTGALNIDGCRVGTGEDKGVWPVTGRTAERGSMAGPMGCAETDTTSGRWPANLIHDGSEEVTELFPETVKGGSLDTSKIKAENEIFGKRPQKLDAFYARDSGSAARFFQQCKGDYDGVWQDLNLPPELASTADGHLSQQKQAVVSALVLAVSSALPEGQHCSGLSMEPSTNATGSELKTLEESVTQAILNIAPRFWHESGPARLSLTSSPVSVVVQKEPTGITTITASHWKSDGSAAPVTYSITPLSLAAGAQVSAKRAFYTAKASKDDRDKGNTHPTVKPTDLMAHLCRLVTPPGGIVLDPFMGSGTTGKAALSEGFQFIGIERDPDYYAICESRFNGAQIGLPLAV